MHSLGCNTDRGEFINLLHGAFLRVGERTVILNGVGPVVGQVVVCIYQEQ